MLSIDTTRAGLVGIGINGSQNKNEIMLGAKSAGPSFSKV